jgi:DNA processing protein
MDDRESLIVLNLIPGMGPVRLRRLVERFGAAAAILTRPPAQLEEVPGIGPLLSRAIGNWRALSWEEEFRLLDKHGLKALTCFDPDYPPALKEIYDPPIVLYVRGELLPADRLAVAVVGSRRASLYGLQAAFAISRQLAARGITVVSGLARGIDGRAHRGALDGGGRTIAVMGSGLLNIYPAEHRDLAEQIARQGAVVSQFPLRMIPEKTNFPLRNRIISGLSLGVLVVEAAKKSGALITAHQALDQGRTVMAIPGRIDSVSAQGTNQLIQDGAKMVRDVEDILEEFAYLFTPSPGPGPGEGEKREINLSPEERIVYENLSSEEKEINLIARETGLAPGELAAVLLSLELKHLVRQLPGKYFQKI